MLFADKTTCCKAAKCNLISGVESRGKWKLIQESNCLKTALAATVVVMYFIQIPQLPCYFKILRIRDSEFH